MHSNTLDENLRWRHKWCVQLLQWSAVPCQSSSSLFQCCACRDKGHPPHAPIEPPPHPTYDLAEVRLSSAITEHCCAALKACSKIRLQLLARLGLPCKFVQACAARDKGTASGATAGGAVSTGRGCRGARRCDDPLNVRPRTADIALADALMGSASCDCHERPAS